MKMFQNLQDKENSPHDNIFISEFSILLHPAPLKINYDG